MNHVVALICTAGLMGAAYYTRPLWAQDKEATDPVLVEPRGASFKPSTDQPKRNLLPGGREDPLPRATFERVIDDDVPSRPPADVVYRRRVIPRPVHEEVMEAVSPEEQVEHKQFRAAIQQLKEIKDDDPNKKEEVAKTLRDLLGKQFDRDLAHREKELVALEERVATLRKQLEKRKSAKNDIIVLRIRTIANEIEGLGFPAEDGLPNEPAFRDFPGPGRPPGTYESAVPYREVPPPVDKSAGFRPKR